MLLHLHMVLQPAAYGTMLHIKLQRHKEHCGLGQVCSRRLSICHTIYRHKQVRQTFESEHPLSGYLTT